jgi:type VI secretion system secreted protein VgrG
MASSQQITLHTSVGAGKLSFGRMTASEHLSHPFELDLELQSLEGKLKFDDFLGQPMSVELTLPKGAKRYWHGIVASVSQVSASLSWSYHVKLVPWLWLLTRTADCRVFQHQSVPDIARAVFSLSGFTDVELLLNGSYSPREYCVQYRETAFNFVARLLEEEGIYYYFKHEQSRHVLVLADGYKSHAPYPGYAHVPYFPPSGNVVRVEDALNHWVSGHEITSGKYVLTDYDFKRPRASLISQYARPASYAHASLGMFDYPGGFTTTGDGQTFAQYRLEELQAQMDRVSGGGNVRGLAVGSLFTLGAQDGGGQHPRGDQNREYLVASTYFSLVANNVGESGSEVDVQVEAIDSSRQYRPARVTPKPLIHGFQTATVVGASGEEIWTDPNGNGCVMVQFPWDRQGTNDEKSSCWIRVSQIWAGKGFGALVLPRVGQEVVVGFLEGDPDRPLVVGSVYNGDQTPAIKLPDDKTQSGLKTRSSKGGSDSNANELRFEDKMGSELVLLHAEKDLTIEVENNETRSVTKDRSTTISNNDKEKVSQDQTIDVGNNYQLSADKQITIKTGQAQIVMKSSGEITISGSKITLNATDKIEQSATEIDVNANNKVALGGVQINVQGTQVTVKGTLLDLSADAKASLKGGITMIG